MEEDCCMRSFPTLVLPLKETFFTIGEAVKTLPIAGALATLASREVAERWKGGFGGGHGSVSIFFGAFSAGAD